MCQRRGKFQSRPDQTNKSFMYFIRQHSKFNLLTQKFRNLGTGNKVSKAKSNDLCICLITVVTNVLFLVGWTKKSNIFLLKKWNMVCNGLKGKMSKENAKMMIIWFFLVSEENQFIKNTIDKHF